MTPPAPVVSGLFPTSGTSSGGTLVEISGADLAHASAVHFGNVASPQVSELSPQLLTAVAPPGASTVDVTVTNPSGTSALATADRYSYSTPPSPAGSPTITSISAASGPVTRGPIVTVSGTNLGGVTSVNFAGEPSLHVIDVSSTQVTATVPARLLPGQVDVTAENAQRTSTVTPSDHFTYLSLTPPPPGGAYTALSPTRVTDTRAGSGQANAGMTVPGQSSLTVHLSPVVPAGASAAALSVTVVNATQAGFLSVYPTGNAPSTPTSVLNFVGGTPCSMVGCVVPNLVMTPVSANGDVTVYNGSGGPVDVIVDVQGFRHPDHPQPTRHHVRPELRPQ